MIKKIVLQIFASTTIILSLIILLICMIGYINTHKSNTEDLHEAHASLAQTIAYHIVKPILESAVNHYIKTHGLTEYLEEIKQQDKEENNTFYEIVEGHGNIAYCGQEVLLQVRELSNSDLLSFLNHRSDITLEIGHDKLKELGLGIIGMKEGGERVVLVSGSEISYHVKLIEVKDPIHINSIMTFDNLVKKTGTKIKCGDEVSIKYNLRRSNGALYAEERTVQFKVGYRQVPLAIDLGVIGMRSGNSRTIIVSPDTLNTTSDILIHDIDFDQENISIISLNL